MRRPAPDKPPKQPVIAGLLASRAAVLASAAGGLDSARELARLADEAVRELAQEADGGPGAPWAVIALGGYGAGRLLPASDLDLLIACDAPSVRVRPFAEAVFYPLWDSGLPVGHQVRTRKEHLRACTADLATLTSSLTGRVIAGDEAFGRTLLDDVAAQARKHSKRVLGKLAERPRPGTPFLLQPDLKESAGGQRDLDELTWTAAVLTGRTCANPSPLDGCWILSHDDLEALAASAELLTAARWELHLCGGRNREVLTLDSAEDLAIDLEGLTARMADIAHALTRARRCAAGSPEPAPIRTPEDLFSSLLGGPDSLPLLEEAAWSGELETMLPGLRELMPMRRPGLSHTLTVGAHSLFASTLVSDAPSKDRFAAEVLASTYDARPLLAATLAHDAGKRDKEPGHAERGARTAEEWAGNLGLSPEQATDAAVLVREHLLLPETAGKADIHDEDVILKAAERIGLRRLVGPLYVLTMADSLATGPDVWTAWRASVLADLAFRLDAALAADVEGAGLTASAETVRSTVLSSMEDAWPPGDERRVFVERAPLRYLASFGPATVIRHAGLAAPVISSGDAGAAELAVTTGPLPGTWSVTIATLDRRGLFARLAGVFALSGLNILGVEAVTGPGGTAIDAFTVASATLATIETETWTAFDRRLRAALADRLAIDVRLAERRSHYPSARTGIPVRVTVDTAGRYSTTLYVECADRIGLLHDLALAVTSLGLDIRSATVLTRNGVASDTFQLTDGAGDPPRDAELLSELRRAIGHAAEAR